MYLPFSVHPGAELYVLFKSAELEYMLCSVKGSQPRDSVGTVIVPTEMKVVFAAVENRDRAKAP